MIAIAFEPTSLEALLKGNPRLPGFLLTGLCLLVLFFVILPRYQSWRRGKGRPVLDHLQVDELLTGPGALVVDLRSPEEYRAGHIRGSLPVPFGDLATHFLKPDPTAKRAIILVDETDRFAHQALDLLTARGFTWMYVMKGGMRAWRKANRPVTK